MDKIIELCDVTQGYKKKTVLRSLTCGWGVGVSALLGPNGAGKTTLLRTLVTDLPPQSGEIRFCGESLTTKKAIRHARKNIGFLPQKFSADPHFTVKELVSYAAWLRLGGDVNQAIEFVGLSDKADEKYKSLSGGMKQRAAIAATIVGDPRVIVFDEPTVGLDPQQRIYFRELLTRMTDRTVIISTHLVEDVATTAQRIIVLADGTIRYDGTPHDLEASYKEENRSPLESGYLDILRSVQ